MRLKTSFDSFLARVHFRSNSRAQEARKHALKSRRLQLESLENRELLSATTWNDATEPVTAVSAVYNPPAVLEGATLEESALSDSIDALLAKAGQDPENLSQDYIFNLSSNPDSTYTIYLDFDGHVNSEGTWWQQWGKFGEITTPAFDLDGDASTFSNAELKSMYEIWLRVSEDYAPFNVNVTTADPGSDALMKTDDADVEYGVRACIGGTSYDWYGKPAGGLSYVSCFDAESDTPSYIWPAQLAFNTKAIAEATAHEVGHDVGLLHDGNPTDGEYYEGADGWAPIMGAGYFESLTQWSKGEYEGATNTEDDLEIITTANGFDYRADDHGDTFATATQISFDQVGVSASGIVEKNTDVDVFEFAHIGGELTFTIGGLVEVTNLDALVKLYDADGNLLETFDPTDSLSVSVDMTNYKIGTYYLSVEGTGKTVVEDEQEKVIYTDYASLGQYEIVATAVPALEDAPDYIEDAAVIEFTEGTATFVNVWGLDNLNAAAKDEQGVTWYYDVDCYAVEVGAGQKITVSFADVSDANAAWKSSVYDSEGLLIAEYNLSGETNSFEFVASEAGKYVFTIEDGFTVPFSSTLTVSQTAAAKLDQPNNFYLKTVSTTQIDLVLTGVEHGNKYDVYYGIDYGYEYDAENNYKYDTYFTSVMENCSAGTVSLKGLYSGYAYCVKVVAKANGGYAQSDDSVVKQRLVFSEGVETPSLVVTTADDVVNATDGKISLREAIDYAEVYGLALDGTAITFADSLKDQTIYLNGEDLNISSSIKIDASSLKSYDADGNLVPGITIDAQQNSRVFYASGEDVVLSLSGLKLTNGRNLSNGAFDGQAGGAVYFGGTILNVYDCVFCDNAASASDNNIVLGGALSIDEGAQVEIYNSVFRNNSLTSDSSESGGAAIGVEGETLVHIENTLFDANTTNQSGGAIRAQGALNVENSTFTDNKADNNGGAIWGNGYFANSLFVGNEAAKGGALYLNYSSSVVNSTITANKADSAAGVFAGAKSNVINSIVVGNTGETELVGKFVGKNSVAAYTAWKAGSTGNVEYKDGDSLFISAAERNFALTSDSIALDMGDSSLAVYADGENLQSYVAGHNRFVGTSVDAGVYEFQGYDDAYEPNEAFATAYDLGIIGKTTTYNDMSAGMFSNRDWYKFTLAYRAEDDSKIELNYEQTDGVNIDLYLYNSDGEKIAESTEGSGVETISLAGLAKGSYYILAYNVENVTTNAGYALTITPPPTPDLTFYQPSGWTDSMLLATTLKATKGKVAFYDYDNICVRFGYGTDVTFIESCKNSIYVDGELVTSYDVDGLEKDAVFTNGNGFNIGTLSVGTHTITVKLDSENSLYELNKENNERTITFTVASSVDDDLEPNNVLKDATDLGTLTTKTEVTDLYAGSRSNKDYYKFTILNDGTADSYVKLNFDYDAEHNVGLHLFDASGKELKGVVTKTGEKTISLDGYKAGTYYVLAVNKVAALTEVSYTLSVVPPAVPDLTFGTPKGWSDSVIASTSQGASKGTFAFYDNKDVYVRFGYTTDETFKGEYQNSIYVDGELVKSYDVNGLKQSVVSASEGFSVGKLSVGTHTITVKLNNSEKPLYESDYDNNEKSITITVASSVDDEYEPNNTLKTATDLGSTSAKTVLTDLYAGSRSNRDYYKFTLLNDALDDSYVGINYQYDDAHNVSLHLYNADGKEIKAVATKTGEKTISLAGYKAGTYYVLAYNRVNTLTEIGYTLTLNLPAVPDLALSTPDGWKASTIVAATEDAVEGKVAFSDYEDVYVRFGYATDETFKGAFQNSIYVDGELVTSYDFDGLQSGEVFTNGAYSLGKLSCGVHTITVKLNSSEKPLYESDYDNNEKSITITVTSTVDDDYEPNDTRAGATDLGELTTTWTEDLYAGAKSNRDYYKFTLLNDGTADSYITLNFKYDADHNVGLHLYNAAGKELKGVTTQTGEKTISLKGYKAGTYYVMAYNRVKSYSEAAYTLSIVPPATPDLTFATPKGWSDSVIVSTTQSAVKGKTSFTDAQNLYVRFGYTTDETFAGEYQNSIYVDGNLVTSYDASGLKQDEVSVTDGFSVGKLSGGKHTITVKLNPTGALHESDTTNNEKTITISVTSTVDDVHEPNNSINTATDLGKVETATTWTDLIAGTGSNRDYYKFELLNDGTADSYVKLNFNYDADHNVGLYLYNAAGKELKGVSTLTGEKSISLNGYKAGTYYVMAYNRVKPLTEIGYTLSIVPPAAPDLTFATPKGWSDSVIVSTTQSAVKGKTSFTDAQNLYVRFGYTTDETFTGEYQNSIYVDGNLVTSYDASGLKQDEVSVTDGFSVGKLSGGKHTITVKLNPTGALHESDTTNNEKTITISVTSTVDDVHEPNNSIKTATDLGTVETATTLTDLIAGTGSNRDYYKFELLNDGTADSYVKLNYEYDADHNVGLYLYNAAGKELKGVSTLTGEKTISLDGYKAGTYYVMAYNRVKPLTEIGYTLSIVPPAVPDLTLSTPDGWSDSVVVSTTQSAVKGKTSFTDAQNVYVRFGYTTDETFKGAFQNSIYVDGELVKSYDVNGLQKDAVYTNDKGFYVGKLSGGTHEITVKLNPTGALHESDTTNNEKTITISVTSTVDDDHEPNNTRTAATDLGTVETTTTWSDLIAGAKSNKDFYKFTLLEDGTSDSYIELNYQNDDVHNVSLHLYNAAGKELKGVTDNTGYKKISLDGKTAGTYYVLAFNRVNTLTEVGYSLKIATSDSSDVAEGAQFRSVFEDASFDPFKEDFGLF